MLEHNRDGFLVGRPMAADQAAQLLSAIKGDTGKILAAMRRTGASGYGRAATPAGRGGGSRQEVGRAGAGAAAPGRATAATATPAQRSGAGRLAGRMRGPDGRLLAGPALAPAAAAAESQVADATKALAATIERQRKDERADKRANSQQRDNRGRFGAGGDRSGFAGGLAGSAGAAVDGAEQVDPLVGAIGEVRGLVGKVRDVATPVGRAAAGMLGGGGSDDSPGLLRRMWRELRAMRKADAVASKGTLAKLAALAKMRGTAAGGGIFGALLGALPGLGAMAPVLGALGASAAAAAVGVKGLAKRIPVVGAVVELITGALEDRNLAADETLTAGERTTRRAANAGSTAGGIGGALAGAALGGAAAGPVGAIIGAVAGGLAGRAGGGAAGGALGSVSARFESGGAGAGAVSSGKGDFGGASYGTHQLSSTTGTLQQYLGQSDYGAQFAGLQPGTPEFNAKWRQLAASDPKFGRDQKDFIGRTHFEPQMAHLAKAGIDLSGKGDAVKEAVWSTSVQFGGKTDLIKKALAGRDLSKMSDADTIAAIQDFKIAKNGSLFKSSSAAVQAGTLRRAGEEKKALLALSGQAPGTAIGASPALAAVAAAAAPRPVAIPSMPVAPMAAAVPAAPQVDAGGPQRLNSTAQTAAATAAPAAPQQDVRDRLIAHIATGGIGGFGGIVHR